MTSNFNSTDQKDTRKNFHYFVQHVVRKYRKKFSVDKSVYLFTVFRPKRDFYTSNKPGKYQIRADIPVRRQPKLRFLLWFIVLTRYLSGYLKIKKGVLVHMATKSLKPKITV